MNNNDECTFELSGESTYLKARMKFEDLPSAGIWKDREGAEE